MTLKWLKYLLASPITGPAWSTCDYFHASTSAALVTPAKMYIGLRKGSQLLLQLRIWMQFCFTVPMIKWLLFKNKDRKIYISSVEWKKKKPSKTCSKIEPLLLFSVNSSLIHNIITDYYVKTCRDPKYRSHSNSFQLLFNLNMIWSSDQEMKVSLPFSVP